VTVSLDAGGLRVSTPTPRDSFRYRAANGLLRVATPDRGRFLLVRVEPRDDLAPAASDLHVWSDGERVAGTVEPGPAPPAEPAAGSDGPLAGTTAGFVAFDLPAPLSGDPRVVYAPGGEPVAAWRLPPDVASALSTPPPAFAVVDHDAPTAVEPGRRVPLGFTVANDGVTGVLRGSCNELVPVPTAHPVHRTIPGGERGRVEVVLDGPAEVEAPATVTYAFHGPGVVVRGRVPVDDGAHTGTVAG
jgi:hypothetical protein